MAVSILSPVKTHTFIPAYFIQAIVEATSAYNLSSIAVAPMILKFLSNLSYKVCIFSSLFSKQEAASKYSLCQTLNSISFIILLQRTSVLRPILPYSYNFPFKLLKSYFYSNSSLDNLKGSNKTESAPLVYNVISFDFNDLINTDYLINNYLYTFF